MKTPHQIPQPIPTPETISPPHSERWWIVATAISTLSLAALLFYDFWTPAVFLAGYDTYTHDYLMWKWGWQTVFDIHRIPLWNPYLFGGWPFVASFAFCPFYPPAWLSVPLPTSLALTLQYALHLAIGASGFYAFARAIRVSPPPALLVALLYEVSAHVATLAFPGHMAKVQAIAWIGWAMASAVMLARDNKNWRWGLALGATWAAQLLASHTQIFYATFWLTTLYAIAASLFPNSNRLQIHKILRTLIPLAVAALVAICLSAIQMIPALELAAQSNRGAGGLSWETAAFGALPPQELKEIALPSFCGDSTGKLIANGVILPYTGTWNAPPNAPAGERLVSDYTGIVAFALALFGITSTRARKRWFFLAAGGIAALISIGGTTPLFGLAFQFVPGFNRFRSPATFMVVTNFSIFALAALGAEHALNFLRHYDAHTLRHRAGWFVVFAMIAAFTSARELSLILRGTPPALSGLPNPAALAEALAYTHISLFACLAALTLALACLTQVASWRRTTQCLLTLFALVAIADGFSHVRHFLPKNPTGNFEYFLNNNWAETAILNDANGATLPTLLDSGRELSNRAMMRAIRSVHGYHPVVFGAYEKLIAATGGFHSPTLANLFTQNYRVIDVASPLPPDWKIVAQAQGRKAIARNNPIPFARIPRRVEPLGAKWDALNFDEWKTLIGDPNFDPSEKTITEGNLQFRSSGEEKFKVESTLISPDEMRLHLSPTPRAKTPGFPLPELTNKSNPTTETFLPCLTSIPAGPGWHVQIETTSKNQTSNITPNLTSWPKRANGFFLLIPISTNPDTQTVLTYRPVSFTFGAFLTTISLPLILLLLFLKKRRHS